MFSWLWHFLHPIVITLVRLRVSVVVQDHGGEPPEGPVLICSKHTSGLDIPLLAHLGWRRRHRILSFQMGSFVGYPILERLVPILRHLGGFTVMRPKEVLRLRKRKGWDRARIRKTMADINAQAEIDRREILESGSGLVVFPEGTRDARCVRPLVAELELLSAIALSKTGREVWVWPVVPRYGRAKRFGRRRVQLRLLPAIPVAGHDAHALLDILAQIFQEHWATPEAVDAGEHRSYRVEDPPPVLSSAGEANP